MVGDAGAPLGREEVPVLHRAWKTVARDMRPRAREVVTALGLVSGGPDQPELQCTDGKECVFVQHNDEGVALCGIQKAWMEGRFDWIKPLSCHLFPVRVMKSGSSEYLNLEYYPSLCGAACEKGSGQGIYLADYLKDPLIRAYGEEWYREFLLACEEVREIKSPDPVNSDAWEPGSGGKP